MTNFVKLFLYLIFPTSAALGQTGNVSGSDSATAPVLNTYMPSFSAKDLSGKTYQTDRLKNKVVFINFWFIDCPPCIQELNQLMRLYDSVATNPNVVFLTVSVDTEKDLRSFISDSDTSGRGGKIRKHYKKFIDFEHAIKYPIISSPGKEIEMKYKIEGWPTSIVIDKKGIIRLVNVGLKLDAPENYIFQTYYDKIKDLLKE